jgi:5-methylcytosine-specific restriction enzyme subunit McrC
MTMDDGRWTMGDRALAAPGLRAPDPFVLEEGSSIEVPLTEGVYGRLRARYARQLEIGPTERAGVYRIAARDHVGRIGLPGGGMLVIRPKVGVANLFHMLTSGPGPARFYPPPTDLAPNAEIFSFIISALVERTEQLLRQGLYRAFLPREEDLPLVRGRIVLAAQLHRYGDLKHRHVCAYADLTHDTVENRVLASALRLLPALLRQGTDDRLVRRVRGLLPRFAGVGVITSAEALALLPSISFHRLNSAYAPVMGLCRLALRHLTLDETAGPHPFASFLVDMPQLFENFVTERLGSYIAGHGLRVVAQHRDYLDETRRVGIRPDVLVYRVGGVAPLLVLDAKYRRLDGDNPDLNRDLYQVSAYLDRYRLRQGVLVYPQFREASRTELRLRGTSKSLHLATLDLSTPDVGQLERNCAVLAEQVAGMCEQVW